MKQLFFLLFSLIVLVVQAQEVSVSGVVLVNGGSFSDPNDNVNVQMIDPSDNSTSVLDSIQTSSAQDLLFDGNAAFVAAQDSIVKYDLLTGQRLAAAAFGAPSTVHMEVAGEYLLVGNFYAPFTFVGTYRNHFRLFDRNTLAFVDSVPDITLKAQSFLVVGKEVYITQNYTSASFTDSAGFLLKLDLNSLAVTDSIAVNSNQEDLGRLVLLDSVIYGINGNSNTITTYDLRTGTVSTDTANAELSSNPYRSQLSMDENGVLFTIIDGKIGSYDLASRTIINPGIVDTVITAFAHDTLNERFYVTQTDFASYSQGRVYDENGMRIGTFETGSSPEVIEVFYSVTALSIDPQNLPSTVQLFPNPTQGAAFLAFAKSWTGIIEVMDREGRRILRRRVQGTQQERLDLNELSEGVYFIQGRNETEFWSHRLIKLP